MFLNKKILCLIPARGGSKGIKYKNLKKIGKKSLVENSIRFAKSLKFLDKIIVSSDYYKILNIAKSLNVSCHLRSKKLSKDFISDYQVIRNVLKKYKNYDYILYLQPTSPFRKKKTVENSIKKFFKNKLDTLFSVESIKHNHNPYYLFSDKKELKKRIKKFRKKPIRQKEKKYYGMDGGAIFMFKSQYKLKRIFGNKFDFVKVSKFEAIDIDTKEDLNLAKSIKFKIS